MSNINVTLAPNGIGYSVARSSSKYTQALAQVPTDGHWYIVATDLAPTTAEQIARKLNCAIDSSFEFGHRQLSITGQLRSELAARSTSIIIPPTTGVPAP